jgi:hypothetical protein
VGWVLSGAGLPAYHWGQVKWEAHDKFQENYPRKYPYLVEWTLQARGWGEPPTNKILPSKPTLRSNFCLLATAQLSMQIPLLGGVDPVGPSFGWTPPKKNFGQTHPEEQLLFAGSRPILNPSGNFRWGQYGRYPWGPTIWVAPWLGAEPGWNEEPMPNFGVMACVSPAAAGPTHTHTFIFIY